MRRKLGRYGEAASTHREFLGMADKQRAGATQKEMIAEARLPARQLREPADAHAGRGAGGRAAAAAVSTAAGAAVSTEAAPAAAAATEAEGPWRWKTRPAPARS